jgi:hypothetical protein
LSVEGLVRAIGKRLISELPSLYFLLDAVCVREFGRGFLEALLSNPRGVYNILERLYGEVAAEMVFHAYILEPALQELSEAEREKVTYYLEHNRYLEAFEVLTKLVGGRGGGAR